MSATTAADLLVRAHQLAIVLRDSHEPITLTQWEEFDVTLHRALHEVIGADAGRIPRRDPHHATLRSAIRGYPAPLRPPADAHLTPAQAAPLLGTTERTVYRWINNGRLTTVQDAEAITVHASQFDKRPDITPADPTDPHPLARLSVMLGVFADQLSMSGTSASRVLDQPGEAATVSRHLLAMARLAAGHTITVMPYADADRPVAVAQYCERVLDRLAETTLRPDSLHRLRSVVPDPASVGLNDRLEAVLDQWAHAAQDDLTRAIPDLHGVRLLGNQAVHLYAVTHQVLGVDRAGTFDPNGATAVALTGAARAVQAADPLWADVTTFARPTLEYATASRELFHVLDDITAAIQVSNETDLDPSRALADLAQANTTIADLMAATRTLAERLARAQLLHIPKGRMTVVELNSHRRLPTKPATVYEVEDLVRAWDKAGTSARDAATQLSRHLETHVDHPLRDLMPIERSL